jgi:hypothetical protein
VGFVGDRSLPGSCNQGLEEDVLKHFSCGDVVNLNDRSACDSNFILSTAFCSRLDRY